MAREIALTHDFLVSLASRRNVWQEFPQVKNLYNQMANKSASCCGQSKRVDNDALVRLRDFVVGLPPEKAQRLKELLNLPKGTTIRANLKTSGGKITSKSI